MRVVIKSREGKMENSRGVFINMVVTNTTREKEILKASITSKKIVGRGISMTKRIITTPAASKKSPCLEKRE